MIFQNFFLILFFLLLVSKGHANQPLEDNKLSTVVVTCASGELGGAIARKLASENNLILIGRNTLKLKELQSELESRYSGRYEIAVLDYCNITSFFELEKILLAREISGLVLITPRPQFGSDLLQSDSDWTSFFQTHFIGPLEVLKKVLTYLTSPGKIVIIGGTTSVQLLPKYGPVCVLRRMWTTYAKALSHQLGPKGISINVLSPGVVLTNFHVERIASQARQNSVEYDEQMKQDVSKIPLGRHAFPEEIAQSVKFLLSSDSDFINGMNLVIDGGFVTSY